MSAESPRHGRANVGGPLTVASQPPSDRSLIDTVSGFLNDVSLSGAPAPDSRDTIQWAHFETADINEPAPEGEHDAETAPLLLVLGYGSGVQVWLIPPNGEAQEVLSWRQGSVRALRILPTPATGDSFIAERPLLALCDSAGPQPLYCSLSFISLRRGEQVKSIKFKNPILDVLANKRSVVVSFSERFAVFDAGTLEDRLTVTTCYPCPCPLGGPGPLNPLALGDRWLAYADKKLNATKRSSGGCEGEGVTSYTATVLHAAKSLSKGLRGLGESVASSLAGGRTLSQSPSPPNADHQQPGVVTILDIEGLSDEDSQEPEEMWDATVAHFVAHSDAIIALRFDASGMLLVTADKRGHDFHVFRVQPHPCHPSLAAVHHLYILHRGDTTAKVQDIAISPDSRWAAVSTLRGTTHVFPVSPYGGACGVRTHTQPRVVNRLSRFHRSAGLPIHAHNARSSSPVGDGIAQGAWYPNPRLPPYPLPNTAGPLAQLRPMPAAAGLPTHTITRNSSGRQRLSSLSEDAGGVPLLACARWGAAPPPSAATAAAAAAAQARSPAAQALYVMAATGHLLHYLIHPRHAAGVAKEKVCEDTPVELGVELLAQWPLSRPPAAPDAAAPLPSNNPLLHRQHHKGSSEMGASEEERWLSQVEIVTHAGPHRRLWMGPQFVFKTYNATLSGSCSLLEAEAVEVEATGAGAGAGAGAARSPPVNMPGARPLVPVLIDSGSASSLEHSPSDSFRRKSFMLEGGKPVGDKVLGDVQLREDLAEAMRETEQGGSLGVGAEMARRVASVARAVDPQGTVVAPGVETEALEDDEDPDLYTQANTDEALFRPVVRAPAALPSPSELTVSPLPAGTTIPVQSLLQSGLPPSPDQQSMPLNSEVVIPAALRYQNRNNTDIIREKEKLVVKQSSLMRNLVPPVETVALTRSYEDQQTIAKEKERVVDSSEVSSISAKIDLDVTVKSTVAEFKVQGASNAIEETNVSFSIEKPVRVAKGSIKGKSRDRMSATPIKSDEVAKIEEKYQPKSTIQDDGINKSKLDTPKKSEDILHIEIPVFSPKPSLGKPYNKHFNTEEKFTELVDTKTNISSKEDFTEFTVQIQPSKDVSGEIEHLSKMNSEAIKVNIYEKGDENVNLESTAGHLINKTEDQIWAMLSENIQEKVKTTNTLTHIKKNIDDVKSKPRKSKKNRTRLPLSDSLESENSVKKSFEDQISMSEDLTVPCNKPVHDKTVQLSQIEAITGSVATDTMAKEFVKAKSLSPETSISVTHIKDTTDQKMTSIYNEDLTSVKEFSPFHDDTESKPRKCIGKEQVNFTKVDLPISAKGRIEEFDIPIDFDSYFVTKDEKLKADSNVSKSNNDAIMQEMVGDSLFSLQKNKFKKPSRKERLKQDDFVSVEKSEANKIDCMYESKKYTSIIIDIDKERTSARESEIKVEEPEIIVVESAMEDFPSIGSSRNMRSHKKRSVLPQGVSSKSIPPIKSYSSITAVSTKPKEMNPEEFLGLELSENILEPPKPSRSSLHEKLVELCKITDIAVAECDAPDDLAFMDDDSSAFEIPPLEFSLDEFKLEVMRDSLLDLEEKKMKSPTCKSNVDDILFDIKDMASNKVDTPVKHKTTIIASAVDQDFNLVHMKSERETKCALKVDTVESEVMEKSSDDDNTSPVSSHTDSDEKEDKKNTATSSMALPTQKTSAKKKSRQKKKK